MPAPAVQAAPAQRPSRVPMIAVVLAVVAALFASVGLLVALRDGDLAYLHIHPHGDEPSEGDTSGPTVDFMAHTPTAGRYLLYFDFQVGGQVHSAHLVLDAASGAPGGAAHHGSHNDHGDHGGHEPGGHDSHGGGHDVHGMH